MTNDVKNDVNYGVKNDVKKSVKHRVGPRETTWLLVFTTPRRLTP